MELVFNQKRDGSPLQGSHCWTSQQWPTATTSPLATVEVNSPPLKAGDSAFAIESNKPSVLPPDILTAAFRATSSILPLPSKGLKVSTANSQHEIATLFSFDFDFPVDQDQGVFDESSASLAEDIFGSHKTKRNDFEVTDFAFDDLDFLWQIL